MHTLRRELSVLLVSNYLTPTALSAPNTFLLPPHVQFGLMQKLSTGNSVLDALLVMLLPLVFRHVMPFLTSLLQRWQERNSKPNQHRRDISHTYRPNSYYSYYSSDDQSPPNHKLQTAILVHLNTLPGLQQSLVNADVKLVKVPQGKNKQQGQQDSGSSASDNDSSDEGDNSSSGSSLWYPGAWLWLASALQPGAGGTTCIAQPGAARSLLL